MISIVVIGVGSIGRRHVSNLIHLGFTNIAVVDADADRLTNITSEFGLKGYSTALEAIQKTQAEVVFVCTPADSHLSLATLALTHGAHVFIEKPIAPGLAGIDELAQLASKEKKLVMVACNFRFHEFFFRLKRILESATHGKVLSVRISYAYDLVGARAHADYRNVYAAKAEAGGGVIFDSGAHVVDYVTKLFGDIQSVACTYGKSGTLDIETEDMADIDFEFVSGIKAVVHLDYVSSPSKHIIEVQFEKGVCAWDLIANTFTAAGVEESIYSASLSGSERTNVMYIEEVRHFMSAVIEGTTAAGDVSAAKDTLQILIALKRAGSTGEVVTLQRSVLS